MDITIRIRSIVNGFVASSGADYGGLGNINGVGETNETFCADREALIAFLPDLVNEAFQQAERGRQNIRRTLAERRAQVGGYGVFADDRVYSMNEAGPIARRTNSASRRCVR